MERNRRGDRRETRSHILLGNEGLNFKWMESHWATFAQGNEI